MNEKTVTMADIKAATARLKPCPFCGEPVEISVLDAEGNYKNECYMEDDPYSGLAFGISHPNDTCLLYSHPGELVGTSYWTVLDELIEDWNTRRNRPRR